MFHMFHLSDSCSDITRLSKPFIIVNKVYCFTFTINIVIKAGTIKRKTKFIMSLVSIIRDCFSKKFLVVTLILN